MGTYEDLKAAIQQVIRTNANNEITGANLQNVLLSIINVVGANATFAGIATPNTNPGTADQNIFYLATEAGIYVNFGGIVINEREAVILSNKTGNWVKTISGFAKQQQLSELSAKVGGEFNDLLKFTNSQVLTIDLYIKKGTTFLLQLTSASSWEQLAVFYGEEWTGGTILESYAVNGETYEFTADEDIQSLKFFLISAPSFVMDVQVSITLLGLSQQVEDLSQQVESLSQPITTERLVDKAVTLSKTDFGEPGKNLFNKDKYNIGVLYNGIIYDGSEDYRKYLTSDYIPVQEGNDYIYSNEGVYKWLERAEVYDINKNYIASLSGTGTEALTIPANGAFFRFSLLATVDSVLWQTSQFEKGSLVTDYEPYKWIIKRSVLPDVVNVLRKPFLNNYADFLTNGESLQISNAPNSKNNHTIGCGMAVDTMGKIRISHGLEIYSFGMVEIDDNNIYEYISGNTTTPSKTTPHNLTIQDLLRIAIIKNGLHEATLILTSLQGEYTQKIAWQGCQHAVQLDVISGEYREVSISIGGDGFKKDIWIFGDSYADFWRPNLYEKGIVNYYVDAYSGRNSINAYTSLQNALKLGSPKILVWMLGMNDGDTNVINTNYKNVFDTVKEICIDNDISFVPCTIPNCPIINNYYKNEYIRANAESYIDMAKILGADSEGSTWYNGLISSDNVHPSQQGTAVIANALIEYIF